MLQSAMGIGLIQEVQAVPTRAGETRTRDQMGLDPCSRPKDPEKFQMTIMTVAMEKV